MSVLQAAIFQNEPKDDLFPNIEPVLTSKKNGIVQKIHFLICGSCFWCASQYNTYSLNKVTKCPCCNNDSIESMPIWHDEVYTFNRDPKRGITLEFSNTGRYWTSMTISKEGTDGKNLPYCNYSKNLLFQVLKLLIRC